MPSPSSLLGLPGRLLRGLRRAVLRRRRLIAAGLVMLAAVAGVRSVSADPSPTQPVLVAARDLPSGTTLSSTDLRTAPWAAGTAPAGTVPAAEAVGRTLAAPMRAGEPFTSVRLVQRSLLAGYPDRIAIPVRLPDPGAAELLQVGDRIDLVAVNPDKSGLARVVTMNTPVVSLPTESAPLGASNTAQAAPGGTLVVVAVTSDEANSLASASFSDFVTFQLTQ